jgi:hypothetical protein
VEERGVLIVLASLAVGALAMPVLLIAWRIYAPVLDERLGIFTGRDLRLFLAQDVSGMTVGATIHARAGAIAWRASHRDWLSETDLEGTTAQGSLCCWTVTHWPPRPWLPRQDVYVTPTNRAAAALIPELVPGRLKPTALPEQACRPGAIYDLVEPQKAHEWLEPHLRRMLSEFFKQHDEQIESGRGRTRG